MANNEFLELAIEKAKESVRQGGFPAGAVVVKDGKVIGEGVSIGNKLKDPTSHGEIVAIRAACKEINATDLSGAILYASMQPCLMCLGAAAWSSISKIVYACSKDKVSVEYYGGHYVPESINAQLIRPIEIVPAPELEEASLKVIREWEDTSKGLNGLI